MIAIKQYNNITIFFKAVSHILFVIISFITFLPGLVSAQAISATLAPSQTELAIKPGTSTILRYAFINRGDPAIYKFMIEPFEASSSHSILIELLNQDLGLNDSIFLKNSSSLELSLRVMVPEDAVEQDYYFNLIAESQPTPTEEGTANIRAKITLKSPLLIIVTQTGQVQIKPKISLMEINSKKQFELFGFRMNIFDSYENIPVILLLHNEGKNLIKPKGELLVRGPLWQSNSYPIDHHTVLADSQKRIELELPGRFVGSYKISTGLNFGQGSPTIFASNSFVVIPFKFTLFIILLPLLLILVLPKFKKKHIP